MLAILSPAKTLDFESRLTTAKFSEPDFVRESSTLIEHLRKYSTDEVASLMGISDKLAELNHRRYAEWSPEFSREDSRPAILAFKGDVYIGLDGQSLGPRDLTWAQQHLRILSGLHGLLRPLDRIHPYRLEMGTRLPTEAGQDLYQFWGGRVTAALNDALAAQKSSREREPILINLASNEYYKVLQEADIDARIIHISFREWKNGKYRFLSFFAKKARGSMARYMIDHRINTLKGLRAFDYDGYEFNQTLSDPDHWVFTRDQGQ